MKLQTIVDIPKLPFSLSYSNRGFFVGSCFAENLESYLEQRLANVVLCPNGQMYNPLSISNCFKHENYTIDDLVQGPDGLWYSWYHHGSVYGKTPDELLLVLNKWNATSSSFDYVVITLGTSWVYELQDGRVVSNCHKMPSSMFRRRLLDMREIVDAISGVIDFFPKHVHFVLTVSPIRHVKDGLVENSLSKALLRVAAGELSKMRSNVYYFPAYEIMNDELRDYRFYDDDMLHPTSLATSYIMERFMKAAFDEKSLEFFAEVDNLRKSCEHKPMHGLTPAYEEFRKKIKNRARELAGKYPDVDFGRFL